MFSYNTYELLKNKLFFSVDSEVQLIEYVLGSNFTSIKS